MCASVTRRYTMAWADVGDVYNVIILIFIPFFGVPMSLWAIWTLRKDWRKTYIIKRKRVIIRLLILYALYLHFVQWTSFALGAILGIEKSIYFIIFQVYMNNTLQQAGIWLVISRFWLYYFDFKLLQFNTNKEWRLAIDPQSEANNWYVKNVRKWGNQYFIIRVVIIISILQEIFERLVYEFGENEIVGIGIDLIGFCAPFIVAIYLCHVQRRARKVSSHNSDNLGIIKELYISSIVISFMVIFSAVIHMVFISTNIIMIGVIYNFWHIIFTLVFLYLQGIYPRYLYNRSNARYGKPKVQSKNGYHELNQVLLMDSSQTTTTGDNSNRGPIQLTRNWQRIVCVYEGYEALMKHLEKEFSGT